MTTNESWLEQLEEQSKQKQAKFISHIASRLGHPQMTKAPSRTIVGAPSSWQQKRWDSEKKVLRFTEHFKSVGGYVVKVNSRDEAAQFIANKVTELNASRVLLQQQQMMHELALEQKCNGVEVQYWNSDAKYNWIKEAAQADIGVVEAEHAVAYTGSVVVTSSADKGRSVSLLPTVLMVIVPKSVIVTTLGEVLTKLDEGGRKQLPAGVHFISGPSRSSDIENDLTIGVHGPGVVFAIVVENS